MILALVLVFCFASCKNKPHKDEETSGTTQIGGEDTTVGGGDEDTTKPGGEDTTKPGGEDTTIGGPDETTTGGGSEGTTEETTEEETTADHEHVYDEGSVTLDPTCTQTGEKIYVCSVCGHEEREEIPMLDHDMGEWEQVTAPTVNTEGLERRECENCDHFEERAIEKLPAVWNITVNDGLGETTTVYVAADGLYSLTTPTRIGYNFLGWKDSEGNDFAASGTVDRNVSVAAVWELDATETLDELIERAAAGVDLILIANDIVIDRPVYVPSTTKICSLTPVKLIRDSGYTGDLFVIGQNADGENSILLNLVPMLTLGDESYTGDEILLTIDGNRDGMNDGAEVAGTALFLVNGARVNMYNGVSISNHQKLRNERVLSVNRYQFGNNITSGGPAAMIASGSAFYMYGGIMDNNSARVDPTLDENGASVNLSGYGGAIFNNGTFHMYGGVISNCTANRGGAIYSDSIIEIVGGVIEGNYAKNKGGAICSSGSDSVDMFIGASGAEIGTVVFRNNSAGSQGGAILSYADSPLLLFGGVLFEGNAALGSNGGAISTSGPITSYNNSFVGNTAKYSGGAIYQTYANADGIIHIVELRDTLFEGNTANKGGAITLTSSADAKSGAYAKIVNCRFVENGALHYLSVKTDSETGEQRTVLNGGNGGAIYSSQRSVFEIENCEFVSNMSENLGGGAIGATVSSKITIKNSLFTDNRAVDVNGAENGRSGVGGAIYAYNGTSLTVSDTVFNGNSAYKNGGALYISSNTVNLTNIELHSNSAGLNGGAIAQYDSSTLNISGIFATGNSAEGTGGVIYNSRSTLNITSNEETENIFGILGATDEESQALVNTATNGGVICGGNTSILNIDGATFENNAAVPDVVETRDEITGEVIKTTYVDGYGGVIYATHGTQINISDSTFNSNSAKYGGAITLVKATTKLTVKDSEFASNISTNCGGALYTLSATADIENVIYYNNTSAKGGALYLSTKSATTVKNSSFTGNTGTSGGAVYASNAQTSTFESVKFESNGISATKQTKNGGVAYIVGTTVDVWDCEFNGNHATSSGGAIYLSGTETSVDSEGVETKSRAAAVNLDSTDFIGNDAKTGGAIYASVDSVVSLNSLTFRDNRANASETDNDARGGAIYMLAANLEVNDVDFINNHADYYGGAIDAHTNSKATLNRVRFIDNSAINNGGALWMYTNTEVNITGVYASGNTTKSSGGFAYTRGILNILADAEFGNVIKGAEEIVAQAEDGEDGDSVEAESFKNAKSGGAIYCGVSSTVTAFGVEFSANTANNGGAIYVTGSAPTFEECEFSDNSATYGGAIYVDGKATVTKCAFGGNSVSYRGGAIYIVNEDTLSEDAKVVITDSDFTANKAIEGGENTERRGGAIYVAEYVKVVVSDSAFDGNEATQYGGAVDVARGSVLYVANSDFRANKATNGGAMWLYVRSTLSISDSSFESNAATNEGGAVYSYGNVNAIGTTFSNNTAKNGGAVFAASGTTVTDGCAFAENTASYGGAIYVSENGKLYDGVDETDGETVTEKAGSRFEGNTASYGGAIYLAKVEDPEKTPDRVAGMAELDGTELVSNAANNAGGAIYASTGATITLNKTTFTSNEAKEGGAIRMLSTATLNDTDSIFEGNIATTEEGGAINSNGSITLVGTKFIENKAESQGKRGGAIYLTVGTLNATNVVFEGNVSSGNGGAIVLTSAAETVFDGCIFKNNTSGNRAGAIYLHNSGVMTTLRCEFNGNSAAGLGGAIYGTSSGFYVDGDSEVEGSGSKFIGNTASGAGALYIDKEAVLNGTVFENNKAISSEEGVDANGGAVTVGTYGTVIVNGAEFSGNTATHGGAIYSGGKGLIINGASIEGNSDGIYVVKGIFEISGSVVADVYLKDGYVITVVGELSEDSEIVITTELANAAFAKADGTNVTDVSVYADRFSVSTGEPVYMNENGYLVSGFVLFEQPTGLNGYTVIASGTPTYTWYLWINGAKGEVVAGQNGATLTEGIIGQSYVCEVTHGDYTLTTDPAIYMPTRSHPMCGDVCDCEDETHENITWLPITTLDEFKAAAKKDGYYYLAYDFELDSKITVSANVNICLNGKKLSRVGEESFTMIQVSSGATLTLTDCSKEKRVGYIDPTTGLWTEGVYSGEGTAIEYTLYGGVITAGSAGGVAINVGGTLNTYGVNFAGNTATSGSAVYGSGSLNDVGSVFVGNVATGQAGAVQIGNATLENTVFAYNRSTENRAGALLLTGGTLYAKGVTFDSNEAYKAGGAVVITGAETSVFENCTFKNNKDLTYRGGAIYLHNSGLMTTLSCTFINNSGVAGGAIYNTSSGAYTDGRPDGNYGSTFIGNTSQTAGGAAYIVGECHLYGTVFENNTSGTNGGAIYVTSALTVENATFIGNTAAANGGAIYTSKTLNASACTFTENNADLGGAIYTSSTLSASACTFTENSADLGGAIYTRGTTITDNCSFTSNTAIENGGAIYVGENGKLYDGVDVTDGETVIEKAGSRFEGNTANYGGAIYLAKVEDPEKTPDNVAGYAKLEGTVISGNVAGLYGGAFYIGWDAQLEVDEVIFEDNKAIRGGAGYISGGRADIADSEFNRNIAATVEGNDTDARAGAIFVSSGVLNGERVKFQYNIAGLNGGAIVTNSGSGDRIAEAYLTDVEFIGNVAQGFNGGAVWMNTGSIVEITGIVAKGNKAENGAGGVFYVTRGTLNILSADGVVNVFGGENEGDANIAENGGVIAGVSSSEINVDGASFIGNNATEGGAVYVTSVANVSNSVFDGNSAKYGGAIYVAGVLKLDGCTVKNNTATLYGGAIYVSENSKLYDGVDEIDVETVIEKAGSRFEGNTASYGGAIYLAKVEDPEKTPDRVAGMAELDGTELVSNAANNAGGAIYASTGATITLNKTTFTSNEAKEGGAIRMLSTATLNDTDSIFEGNIATTEEGGAINSNGSITLVGTKFIENKAESQGKRGGAIYLTVGTLNATNVVFEGNVSSGNGGAIVLTSAAETVFDGCIFKNNTSGNRAGAIYLHNSGVMTTLRCEFNGNSAAGLGGAIYGTSSGFYVDGDSEVEGSGSKFIGNTASGAGALYIDKEAVLNGTVFENNKAISSEEGVDANGGAVTVGTYGTVIVNGAEFSGNTATHGGAIYSGGKGLIINGASIEGNSDGIYVVKGIFEISGSVVADVYLKDGYVITVVGELSEDSEIVITTELANAAFAKADGTNVTDVSVYADRFSVSTGEPVYMNENGYLVSGFVLFEQPTGLNGYTVIASGTPTYTWYLWINGAKGEVVAGQNGATLTEGIIGQSYVCEVTHGDYTLTTDPAIYMPTRSHPMCGDVCDCEDETHENITWLPITTLDEFKAAAKKDGYYYLAYDFELDSKITVSANVNICLNGKKLSRVGEESFTMIQVSSGATLTLTDCSKEKRVGYIDPTTGLWTEGVYSGEGTAIEYTLYGGVINDENSVGGVAIYVYGTLNAYGINFAGNSATSGSAIYFAKGSVSSVIDECVFVGNTASYRGGAVYVANESELSDENKVIFTNSVFDFNKAIEGGEDTTRRGGAIYVAEYVTIAVNNCSFEGNEATQYGGAIDLARGSVLVLTDSYFEANKAGTNGGAIWLYSGTTLTVTGCEFTNNVAGTNGGAIYAYNKVDIYDSVFTGNTATTGGAIYTSGTATATDCTFTGNSATANGGAIYTSKTLNASDCTFTENNADLGGAIYTSGTTTTTDCTFTENNADLGGAIYTSGTTTTTGCTFTGNSAAENGGAIYVAKGMYTDGSSDSSDNGSTFTSNVAANGGAIYVAAGFANTYGSVFKENSVKTEIAETTDEESGETTTVKTYLGNGGSICVVGGASYNGVNTTFEGNIAAHGGAIYVVGTTKTETDDTVTNIFSTVTTVGCDFISNKAIANETTVTLGDTSETTVTYSNGGALYVDENGIFTDGEAGNEIVSTFANNTASYGGAIYLAAVTNSGCEAGKATLENTALEENSAVTCGGAIYLASGSELTVNKVSFEKNSANRGGAVYVSGGTATFTDSEFVANNAVSGTTTARGGAIFAQSGTITATGVSFRENTAVSNAGAIVLNSVNAKAYLTNVEFINNVSGGNGGALWLYSNATAEITGVIAKGNKAESGYGGFAYLSSGTLSVLSGEGVVNAFGGELEGEENVAKSGGAIGGAGVINVSGTSFIGNKATSNGGAIYTSGESNIDNCTFVGNTAANGGAIYATSEVTVNNSDFEGNTSSANGGAIYISGTADITDSEFIENSAKLGGAIYTSGTTTTTGCTFTGNSAVENGGAVYVAKGIYTDGEAVLEGETLTGAQNGSSFTSNTATNGGAICVEITASDAAAGTVKLYGSTFTSNSASTNGGALANIGADAEIYYSSFDSNSAGSKGGAIMSTSFDYDVDGTTHRVTSTLTMIGGEVKNGTVDKTWSSSGSYGGGIAVYYGSQATLDGVVFDNNKAYSGGAITSYGSAKVLNGEETVTVYTNVILNNVTVKNNDGQNGAIYVGGAGRMTVHGLTAIDNTTKGSGAVIYLTSANSVLTVNSATISGNKSGATHNDLTTGSLGFIQTANSANTLNIYKAGVTGADVNDNWDVLIKKGANSTVNELTAPTTEQ